MKIKAIKCKKCNDIIYSRARHDYHGCSCKSIYIDGGFDYIKITGEPGSYDSIDVDVDASKEKLYIDWARSIDKFGLISSGSQSLY
jgi:hypothetical protein